MNKPRTRKSIFWSQSKLSLIDALQNSDLAFSTHFEDTGPNKFEENKVSSPETVESATVSSGEKVPGYGMQSHPAAPRKFTPRRLFQMAIDENNKVNQGQALSSPRMLKEYKYKKSFGFANIVEQAQQQAHQTTLFTTSQVHTTDFNFAPHEFMDSPALTFSPSSYTPAESPDIELDSAKIQKRKQIRRVLLATYFLGIVFSERNRVKAFGPLKGRQTVISNEKGEPIGEKTGILPLMPGSHFNMIWNVILFFLLILSIILTPVSISFISDDDQTFKNIDLFFTVGFGIDIIINFLSAYQESKNVLQTDMRYIALHYIKGWFWIDVLAVIPFDIIITGIAGAGNDNSSSNGRVSKFLKLLKFSRLSRLLRVLRLFKLLKLGSASQTIKKTFNKLKINMALMGLLKVFGLVLAVNHLFGCLWFISARFADFGPETWVARESLVDADAWTQYLASYYWASQCLTTVGYGDISAETATERILAILWMVVGVGFYSFTIGNLSSFLADSDRRSLALQNKLMAFNTFAKNARLSEFVRQKIQTFYEQNHKENVYYWIDPSDLLTSLPTPLKKHLLFHSYYPMIQDIHLLKMDVNFTIAILLDLKVLKLAKGDILYREEDPSAEVYFVCKGSVNLLSEERDGIFSFVQGTYFGELEIFKKTTRASFCEAAEPTKILACDKTVFLKALEKFPKIKAFVTKNTNVRSEIFENKMSAIKDRHHPKTMAKSAPDLASKLRNDARRQTKKLLKSSVYFLNMLQKTQKKPKLNDIPEEGTPKSSKTNQSMNSSSLFNWVSNRTATPRGALGKVLKVLKRSSETIEENSAAKTEKEVKDIRKPQKTVSHPVIKMEETSSMNLLENNTSITPINSMTTVGSQKASGFGEKKLQIKGSINLDDESPIHKGSGSGSISVSGSESPVKSILMRNRSLSPMNIFKKKVAPLQGTADPTNSNKIVINRSASEDSVSELPKIQITPTSGGQRSPFKSGLSPFAKRGSWIGEIKTKMNALNEMEKDKIIPEEPSSTTSKVSKFPISKASLDENISPTEPKISISDHAYFKKLAEKFNQVYKLREKNESIIQDLKSKKEEVNENISELLNKQAELDVMIKKLFELRK